MSCNHQNFEASVHIHRLTGDASPDMPTHWTASIHVRCAECKLPFRWLGLPKGAYWDANTTSVDELELRAPLHPDDGSTPLPPPERGYILAPK